MKRPNKDDYSGSTANQLKQYSETQDKYIDVLEITIVNCRNFIRSKHLSKEFDDFDKISKV